MVLQGTGRTPGRGWCSRGQGGLQVEGGAPGDREDMRSSPVAS